MPGMPLMILFVDGDPVFRFAFFQKSLLPNDIFDRVDGIRFLFFLKNVENELS